jgi:pilus assembly protein CpaE
MRMIGKFGQKADAKRRIRLAIQDHEFARRLGSAIAANGSFDIETVEAPIAAIEPQDGQQQHIALLVVELDPGNPSDLGALERAMAGHAGLRVIVVADEIIGDAARALLRLQVADWLPKTASDSEILRACERAMRPESAARPGSAAEVYTFLPAAGGVGNTSLAIQSAFLIGARTSLSLTCLADLDLQGGSIADYLDLAPNLQLDEIAPSPERLDDQLFEVMLSRHASGISILAAHNSLRDYGDVSQEVMARLLDLASLKFDHVIIDLPRVWLPWTEGVLRGSDRVYVVTEMTVPGLRQAYRLIKALEARCGANINASVIVNRCRPRLISGGVNSLRRRDAEQVLGESLAGFVSEDYRLVREAIDRGVPLYQVKRRNSIDKDLARILFAPRS